MSSKCGSSHDYDSWADMCKHGALRLVTLVRVGEGWPQNNGSDNSGPGPALLSP